MPQVAPVTAAVFLGSIGDPTAYDTQQQVLKVAGLSLVESLSGTRSGEVHISKRGRPVLRRSSYMLALRMIHAGRDVQGAVRRNGRAERRAEDPGRGRGGQEGPGAHVRRGPGRTPQDARAAERTTERRSVI